MGDLREPITRRYLTPIPREPKPSAYHSVFALPKCICMFINICSRSKTKNKAKAVVALEADMCPNDVNVRVVAETHLKRAQPDAIVNIANYSTFRRDRNWSRRDMRNNGGIAIYIRNNFTVVNVYCSTLYEVICRNLRFSPGHRSLACGM